MSVAEIRFAANSELQYDIYRLFEVTERSARFRVARNVGNGLKPVLNALVKMPAGVAAETLSFDPGFFDFENSVYSIEMKVNGDSEEEDVADE
jgi:hypothetical protein